MKKFFLIISVLLAALCTLSACVKLDGKKIEAEAVFAFISSPISFEEELAERVIIRSGEQLETFAESYHALLADENVAEVFDAADYGEEFFEDNALLLFCWGISSSYKDYRFHACTVNGDGEITVVMSFRMRGNNQTDDYKPYFCAVSVKKADIGEAVTFKYDHQDRDLF